MNTAMIRNTLGQILRTLSLLLLIPLAVGLIYKENVLNFAITAALGLLISFLFSR